MRTWYTMKALAAAGEAEISIHDEIGYWGITAKDFIADLKKLNAKKITLSINSPGGSVFDGFAIMNALKASGAEINVSIIGIAASMASVIAMVGKTRTAPANAMVMVHNAISGIYGDAEDLRGVADVLDKIDNSIVATYVATTGKNEKDMRDLMAADTFMTASEALANGFLTEVTGEMKVSASFELDKMPENVKAMFKASACMPEPGAPVAVVVVPPAASTPDPAFADQVEAMADAAGLKAYAAHWALGATDIKAVETLIAAAREVNSLCALAKQPDAAAAFIKAATPIAEVRVALVAALAKADLESSNSTSPPGKPKSSKEGAHPQAINTGSIWEARRKSTNQQGA